MPTETEVRDIKTGELPEVERGDVPAGFCECGYKWDGSKGLCPKCGKVTDEYMAKVRVMKPAAHVAVDEDEFGSLDMICNLAKAAGAPAYASFKGQRFQFCTGPEILTWNIDLIEDMLLSSPGTLKEVIISDWYSKHYVADKTCVNIEYAKCIKLDRALPVLQVEIGVHHTPRLQPHRIGQIVPIDGNHRMYKAWTMGLKSLPGVVVPKHVEFAAFLGARPNGTI